MASGTFERDKQYWKFSLYGFLKNLRFFDPYLLLFFRETGLSFTLIGVLFSIRELVTNIMEVPSGIIADTFGRRKSMVFCFASYIISFLLFYAFPLFGVYVIAMVFFAMGEAFRTGTHKAMILEHLRLKNLLHLKATYYGHTRGWSQTGSALSAFLAAIMVFYTGSYSIVFLFSVIPYIFGLLLMLSYPKALDYSVIDGKQPPRMPGAWQQAAVESIKSLGGLFSDRTIRRGILNFSLFDALFKSIKDYLQPLIEQMALVLPVLLFLDGQQRSAMLIGIVYTILFLLTSFASRSAGSFKARLESTPRALNRLFVASSLCIIISAVGYYLGIPLIAVLCFILYYMIQNLQRPLAVDYMSDAIESSVMATGLSGESQVKTLLTAIFAPLFGLCVDLLSLSGALAAAGIFALLVAFGLKVKDLSR